MIVGKIWDGEYPWDVRVEKVCRTLNEAGHQVHLACRNQRRRPELETHGDLTIHRMPPWPRLPSGVDGALSFPAFFSPRWSRLLRRTFRDARVDVILCRDLPLAPLAIAVGRSLGRPVALDIAEHYPGLLKDLYNRHEFKPQNVLIRNPWLASVLERWTMPRADAVLVVVEEMAERMIRLGVPGDRLAIVCNTPLDERIEMMARIARPPRQPGAPLHLVYLGNIERSRGVHVVLDALAILRAGGHDARLDIFGAGRGLSVIQEQVARLGLADRIALHGHVPYESVLQRLPHYDAGLIPHHATEHWNFTIQNKMFDYMAAGLPVIVSSMPPAARIVRETGAGLVFQDRDPADLARLLAAFPPADALAAMSAAGRRAVGERYRWSLDGARLLEVLERLARHGRRQVA